MKLADEQAIMRRSTVEMKLSMRRAAPSICGGGVGLDDPQGSETTAL